MQTRDGSAYAPGKSVTLTPAGRDVILALDPDNFQFRGEWWPLPYDVRVAREKMKGWKP